MSIGTIFGILFGIALMLWAVLIATNKPIIFLDFAGFIMVFGGTLASTFISYEPRYVFQALKTMGKLVFAPKISRNMLTAEVGRVIRWGYLVQKRGLSGLEAETGALRDQDRFLHFGIDLVVTNYTGDEVREIMAIAVESAFERATIQADILKSMGSGAPAWGMVGTLVGLIIMLESMGGNPSALGPGLAVALTATLYGVLAARMFFLPAAAKIQQREEIHRFRNHMMAEGLALLADRKSPRYIQDKMNSFLDPAIHFSIDRHLKAA